MGENPTNTKSQTRGTIRPPSYRPVALLPPAPVSAPKLLEAGSDADIRKSIINEVSEKLGFDTDEVVFSDIRSRGKAKLRHPYMKGWGISAVSASKRLTNVTHEIQSLSALAKQTKEPLNLFVTARTQSISPEIRKLITGDIFVYDLATEQFHFARFKPGTSSLLHDYPDAAELASRQVANRAKKITKPKRNIVTANDIKAFETVKGHIGEYKELRDTLKKNAKQLGIEDIGDLFEVDHLLEKRFQRSLYMAGAHMVDDDNMMSKVVPRNKDIAKQVPGYKSYPHLRKTQLVNKLIPHGLEELFSPQQIWDAHVKVFKELGLDHEIEMLKNFFKDFEPAIVYRTSFSPDHFDPKKWKPEKPKKKRRSKKAIRAQRKRAKARKAAKKKEEIESSRKRKKPKLQKTQKKVKSAESSKKSRRKSEVKRKETKPEKINRRKNRFTGVEHKGVQNNGVVSKELPQEKAPHAPAQKSGSIKKGFKKVLEPLAEVAGLVTLDANDLLVGSASKVTKVKVGFTANLIVGVVTEIMFSYLEGKLSRENTRGIQRGIKNIIYEPLLKGKINQIVEQVQAGDILINNPRLTNKWLYYEYGYIVVMELQNKDFSSDGIITIFRGLKFPEVYIEVLPSEMNTRPDREPYILTSRPAKKDLLIKGKRKLMGDSIVHYPYLQRLLLWDPEAANLFYRIRKVRNELLGLAKETMKKAGIEYSENKWSPWQLLLFSIENYQFLAAYEAVKDFSPAGIWRKLKISLGYADALLVEPSNWPADRKSVLMLYLGIDPFKPRSDLKKEIRRREKAEFDRLRFNSPMGNKL